MKKSDDDNAADIGVYQDIHSATADPSGKMFIVTQNVMQWFSK